MLNPEHGGWTQRNEPSDDLWLLGKIADMKQSYHSGDVRHSRMNCVRLISIFWPGGTSDAPMVCWICSNKNLVMVAAKPLLPTNADRSLATWGMNRARSEAVTLEQSPRSSTSNNASARASSVPLNREAMPTPNSCRAMTRSQHRHSWYKEQHRHAR